MPKFNCSTRNILKFHGDLKIICFYIFLKILCYRRLNHTNFNLCKKFIIYAKREIQQLTNISIILFSKKCQNWSVIREKYYVFILVIKVLCNRRLTHTNFNFLKQFVKMHKVMSNTLQKYQLSYFLKNVKIKV